MNAINLPHNFTPRDYQIPLFKALDDGYKRILAILHRRAGKDATTLSMMIREMFKRKGYYLYVFPTASLARRVIWQGAMKDGTRFLDFFPSELIKRKQDQTMMIELTNGSIFQLVGSDRFTNVGINPLLVVFSEFSLQDPSCWNYIRPILAENDGIAIFQGTPRGRNHFYDMYETVKDNPKWFVKKLGVNDTGAVSLESIEDERLSGLSEEVIQQEFYVSFTRGVEGSYYGKLVDVARREGRITKVLWEPDSEVHCAFDLGMNDSTTIWWWQNIGREIHIIDYYEMNGEPLSHYVKVLKNKPYVYGDVYLPHDARVRELGTGVSRIDTMRQLGISPQIVPMLHISEGIDRVRNILPRCWFDEEKCKKGIETLECYHKEYNSKYEVYSERPVHDKYSHGADCFRMLSIVVDKSSLTSDPKEIYAMNRENRRRI